MIRVRIHSLEHILLLFGVGYAFKNLLNYPGGMI